METDFDGTTQTISEGAHEGETQFSSPNAIEAGEDTEESAPEGDAKEQRGVHPCRNLCPWTGSRFHSFDFVARGFAEGQGRVWEARELPPGGKEKPQRGGRGRENEGRTIGDSPPDVVR